MGRSRMAVLSLLGVALVLGALPALASARGGYFTGAAGQGALPYAAPVDFLAQTFGGATPFVGEGAPPDVAISPDGSTAYVPDHFQNELQPIAVATNTAGTPIPLSGSPWGVAVSPDGKRAYTANRSHDTVSVIDLIAGSEVATIPVGGGPSALAITPDGSRAYVADRFSNTVTPIDLTTATPLAPIPVAAGPLAIAVTPDGSRVYVVSNLAETVSRIDVATNTVAATIPTAGDGFSLAITPDGSRAYVLTFGGAISIDLATEAAGAPIAVPGFPGDIAVLPDGSRAFVTLEDHDQIVPLDLATNSFGSGFAVGERPEALAGVPNQPPHAAFAGPASAAVGAGVGFDAHGTSDPDGAPARYDWDFGDGSVATNAGPTPVHTYAKPGTYQVTLTVTDNEGCSTALVFTGQTAYCNGSGVARVTHPVTISSPSTSCISAFAKATSFKPKVRPGRTVAGVRVRLSASDPAQLRVSATLLADKKRGTPAAKLAGLNVFVNRWRRVRFTIPARLREDLPLGSRVKVRVAVQVSPRSGPACPTLRINDFTLNLKVVRVFPNAVQFKRVR